MAQTFEAIISLNDKVSAPVQKMQEKIEQFGKSAENVAKGMPTVEERLAKLEAAAAKAHVKMSPPEKLWKAFSVKLHRVKEQFGELAGKAGEFGGKIAEIFPMLGALGAVGSVGGIFELAHHFAENTEALDLAAQKIGVTTGSLQQLDFAAKMTGLQTDSFNDGLTKLDKNLGAAALGKNKALSSLLAQLHVSLKDTKGNVIDAADAMPALEKAFASTHDAAVKAEIAQIAFGRSGLDMIPFLNQGPAKIAALMAEFTKLGYTPTDADKLNASKFIDSWKELETAVGGFTDELGAKLTPVLTPIVSLMTDWIAANRDWISTDIASVIQDVEKKIESWFKAMGGMKGIKADFKTFGADVHNLTGFAESLATAGKDVYAGWKDIVGFFTGISNELNGLISNIEEFDRVMNIGGPANGHYVKQGGRQIWVPHAPGQAGNDNDDGDSSQDANGHYIQQGPRRIWVPAPAENRQSNLPAPAENWRPNLPSRSGLSERAPGAAGNKVDVNVKFANAPPGLKVTAVTTGRDLKRASLKGVNGTVDNHR